MCLQQRCLHKSSITKKPISTATHFTSFFFSIAISIFNNIITIIQNYNKHCLYSAVMGQGRFFLSKSSRGNWNKKTTKTTFPLMFYCNKSQNSFYCFFFQNVTNKRTIYNPKLWRMRFVCVSHMAFIYSQHILTFYTL